MKGRQRGRNGGKPRMHHQGGGGGGRNPNFDHNAGRMRGNAQQLMDKYLALARDASSQGDRVLAENYFQHADHYYRVINARFEGQQNNQQQRRFNGPQQQGGFDGQDGQGNYAQAPYNEHGRLDIPPPAPSQNLMPNAMPVIDPNQPIAPVQAQPVYEANYQPSAQPAPREPDGDIGLPPQLFGGQPPRGGDPEVQEEPQGGGQNRGGDDRGFRPRHAGRRRFGGRRDGTPEATSSDGS
ncbi:MAG: DUF4167 domain-containing protein [Rhodospirillaceae bacterium]|nr:DUF4167 domain-containing protein [Rhodospirillaceae bacterium]